MNVSILFVCKAIYKKGLHYLWALPKISGMPFVRLEKGKMRKMATREEVCGFIPVGMV